MRSIRRSGTLAVAILVCLASAQALANGPLVPPPTQIPGKEYSNNPDENAVGALDAMQNIAWDGLGNAWDTFDYDGVDDPQGEQVDALANIQDALFFDVIRDQVPMVLSFNGTATGTDGDIYYQTNGAAYLTGVWAAGPVDINKAFPPDDVDGLEVWGPEVAPDPAGGPGFGDDANLYSLLGDPGLGGGRVSVWQYDQVTGASFMYMSYPTMASIVAAVTGVPEGDLPDLDLDAMMVFDDRGEIDEMNIYDPYADSILFSVRATSNAALTLDGGEIFVNAPGAGILGFLTHGGELWDTLHTVGADFGVGTEEVNALEAIPEPATLSLLALTGLGLLRRRR